MKRNASAIGLIGAALCALTPVAQASGIISFEEVGANVVATGTAAFNLSGFFPNPSPASASPSLRASIGLLALGGNPGAGTSVLIYNIMSGPTSIGPGNAVDASAASGPVFGMFLGTNLVLPVGYVNGTPLNSTATFSNQTLSSLGLTVGSYQYTWGAGETADSLTVRIGAAAQVPEPSTVLLGLAGFAGLAGALSRRRRRT